MRCASFTTIISLLPVVLQATAAAGVVVVAEGGRELELLTCWVMVDGCC
jgi:hypothetical protein